MKHWYERIVEAADEDTYYKCFDAATRGDPNVQPDGRPPASMYERWYEPLEQQILSALAAAGVPSASVELFDDWVPNCTRHVTVEQSRVTPAVVTALHGLLTGDYQRWRIELMVDDSMSTRNRVANIGLWEDWLLCWGVGRSRLPTTPSHR